MKVGAGRREKRHIFDFYFTEFPAQFYEISAALPASMVYRHLLVDIYAHIMITI